MSVSGSRAKSLLDFLLFLRDDVERLRIAGTIIAVSGNSIDIRVIRGHLSASVAIRRSMNCPKCHRDTKVMDSRTSSEGMVIRRRRECRRCGFRFSTVEEIAILDLTIIKRDGRREPYNREKIVSGLRKAFEKRPITSEELRRLVAVIERDIQLLRKPEVRSAEIGDILLRHLRKADEVAYVRFASVYQSFSDLQGFRRILQQLESPKKIQKQKRKK